MRYFVFGVVRALALAALFSTFSSGFVQAASAPSPEVVKGLYWLQTQVQADGTLANEASSIATSLQSRAETLQTLKLLATVPVALADQLFADTEDNTEYLARRAVTLSMVGVETSAITALLATRQNMDGGFGGAMGYESNALDTAWVILAMAQNGLSRSTAAQTARNYLIAAIQSDGGVGAGSDYVRVNANAVALLALQMSTPNLNTATALKQINTWLLLKQGIDGSWMGDGYLTALSLSAVSPLVTDSAIRAVARNYLSGLQGADGSWSADPFLTAVVLRALAFEPTTAPVLTSSVIGQVFDSKTATALAGATITLSGATAATTLTLGDGHFSVPNLTAGSYVLQVSKAGYVSYTNTYQLSASQVLDVGAIVLGQLQTTSIVRGQIIAATTGQPLSGAAILLNGGVASAISDANGNYEFVSVAPGIVTLDATIQGYIPVSGSGNLLAGQTLVFSPALFTTNETAPTTGRFTGKVVTAGGGGPLAGVSIGMNGTVVGVTAADGSFDLELPPASYAAEFTLTGYDSASTGFLLTAGAVVNAGTVTLSQQLASTTISGVVKDISSGQPINGVQVQVLNGSVATTGVDGVYSLSGLSDTSFALRVSATGYVTQLLQLLVNKPSNIVQDIALDVQSGAGLSLEPLMVNPGSAASRADIGISATVSNATTGTPVSAVLTMQVLNSAGEVVSSAVAYEKTGANLVGVFTLNASEQLPVMFRWNTGQFPAGTYSLVARVIEAGTINQTTPLGRMLAEAQGTLTISSDQHFSGTVAADPPVLQINTNTPVHLSAILANDGNSILPAQAYQLQIVDEKTGTAIATQQVNGNAFLPSEIQSLNFADWMPIAGGGNYRLEIKAASDPALGKIIGKVYVGDAATAAFTVNKLVVPAGMQAVKGKIHVNGQDATQGTISDPLAPLIKAAVQKAVTYNDATAANWYSSNRCLGCHVVSQGLVGGELNRKITTFNASQRQILFNALTTNQQISGAIYASHPEYARTQTILGLWALGSWYKKDEVISPMAKAANYLIGQQEAAGSWTADHASGWWPTRTANTGITLKSMVEVDTLMKQIPSFVGPVTYSLTTLISGGAIPGNHKGSAADVAGNIYVTSYTAGTLSIVKPNNTVQILLSGLSGPRPPAFGSDGALYIPTDTGVIKYLLAGQKTTLTTVGATGVALGPDGNMYAANYWNNKISMITPAGTVTDYIVGGGLSYPHGIAFDQTGALLVANAGNYKVLKYNADKTYTQSVPSTSGAPYFILPDGANYLVATSSGLYRYNAAWQAETLVPGMSWSLAKTPDGKIFVGNSSDTLYVLQEKSMQVRLDTTITNATNWLMVDSNIDTSNHIDLAMRLIGLGSAKKYYAGTATATTLQTKMEQIGTLLRSRQRADGGWGWRNGNASDSMVTAMVGVALDYLQPSPKDPVVQNAIKLLLSKQLADGSWASENRVLDSHLAATTWVAIWLPIALDRIAGIDADLTVAMPANVSLTNPTIAPTSSVMNAAGGTDYTWKLQGVTSAGLDINFDLSLADMLLGETRAVANDAYLTFNNSFTQSTVRAPVSVPRVTASAFLDLGVTTDKTSYGANTPVNIAAAVNNTSAGPLDGSVQLEIFGADNVLAAAVVTQPFSGLAAGAQIPLSAVWNTGTTATGGYYVLATLYDAQNRKVGTAQSVFAIVASDGSGTPSGVSSVGTRVTLDKLSYLPFDLVKISGRISNLTQNEVQSGLQAVLKVYLPDGTLLWTQTGTLQQLLAGSFIDLGYGSQLSAAPAGQYKVTLSVLNPAVAEVARAETFFNVLSTAGTGSGLKGVISALPKVVPHTDPVILDWTVSNLGNDGFIALPITVSIVDPATQLVMLQQAYSADIAQGKSFQTAFGWNTETGTIGITYVAILSASVGGKDIVLARDNFQVIEPPVKLDVKQDALRESRVLVWLACDSDNEGKDDDSHDHGKSDSKSSSDDHDHKKAACIQTRTAFLQNLLTSLNLDYLITSTREDFRKAFRSGRYNTYWLSGKGNQDEHASDENSGHQKSANKASGHEIAEDHLLDREIREAVYRGDGLILDGKQPGLAKALQESLGIKNEGQLPLDNALVTTASLLFPAGQLPTMGRAQKMVVTSGIVQATFNAPAKGDEHHEDEHHGEEHHDNDDAKPEPVLPAIISNDYGKGHAIVFAFDLVDTLQNSPAAASWTQLLQTGIGYTLPPQPDNYSAGAYVTLSTHIQNLARTVDLNVNSQLPMGAALLQTAPVAALDANGQPTWSFRLPENASQMLKLTMRLPALSDSHTARTYIDNLRNGNSKRYGEYVFNWTVAACDRLANNLLSELQALVLKKGEEREARNQAVSYLNKATALIAMAQYAEALEALLKSVDKLRKISSVDISSYRLSLDTMLQETAWNWLRTASQ